MESFLGAVLELFVVMCHWNLKVGFMSNGSNPKEMVFGNLSFKDLSKQWTVSSLPASRVSASGKNYEMSCGGFGL